MKNLTDKQKLLTVALIGTLLVIALSATYAFFSYTRAGTTENTIKSGSITFLYDELNQEGNSIAITDAMPMTDTEGKAQDKYFNFKIVSKTGNTNSIPYDITVRKKDESDNLDNYVKIYLAKIDNYNTTIANETEVTLDTYNNLQDYSINNYTDKLVYRDIVPASNDSYTQYYRLKMWIDNSTPLSNETMNKTFTLTVNVYANGHLLDANSGVATVNSLSVGGTQLTVTSTENGIDYYEATVPEGTTETILSVNTGDYTNVHITKTQSDYSTPIAMNGEITRLSQTLSKRVSLTNGANYFKIVATSEDGTDSKEIHACIKVTRAVQIFGKSFEVNDNTPSLATTSAAANEKGLYAMDVANSFGGGSGTTYFFRGDVTNNIVEFAGLTWRIVRINEDGTIRLILDSAINTGKGFNSAANSYTYVYYTNSGAYIKQTMDTWYSTNITGDNALKVATGNYFCEAAKVASTSNLIGNVTMTPCSRYTPSLDCTTDANGKGLVNASVGFMTYDEVVMAGGKLDTANKSYYLYKNVSGGGIDANWWTMSPAGSWQGNFYAWKMRASGTLYSDGRVDDTVVARPVINLKADVTATGTGTQADPFVIQ